MSRILVDTGSLVDIIFKHTLELLDVRGNTMKKAPTPLVEFSEGSVWPLGTISPS